MKLFANLKRNASAITHDAVMAAGSFVIALYLRLGDDKFYIAEPYIVPYTIIFTALATSIFIYLRAHRGLWHFAAMQDLVRLSTAAGLSVVVFYAGLFAITRLEGVPRSVPFIHIMLFVAMLGAPRFLARMLYEKRGRVQDFTGHRVPVLLIGANHNADLFIRDIENSQSPYQVVGMLDDDPKKAGSTLRGVPIFGDVHTLETVVQKLERKGKKPQRIVFSDSSLMQGEKIRNLLKAADTLGISLGAIPKLTQLHEGAEESLRIKPITIEDLLGRAQTVHDHTAMRDMIQGKRVLITGAGGTIGSELTRQIASFAPALLVLYELNEFALYAIDHEMETRFPEIARASLLGDVRNTTQVSETFARHKPDVVFHAAAIKHVPLAEANPMEAMITNVFGTKHIADACVEHSVHIMAMISTDKAVNPTNVMGATKRLAERYIQGLANNTVACKFVTIRFGNVLGSTGSVVPLFQKQIASGGPITVTHPDIVRYFMTVREAVELVIQAATMGAASAHQGSVFVLDMGAPIRIVDLARQMIRLSGLKPDKDIKITYTGLRAGEKLYEELFYKEEEVSKTAYASILLARIEQVDFEDLQKNLDVLLKHCNQRNAVGSVSQLQSIVTTFKRERAA